MNQMLVAVFDNEAAAGVGLQALQKLHAAGDITLYATGVMVKSAQGVIRVKKSMGESYAVVKKEYDRLLPDLTAT